MTRPLTDLSVLLVEDNPADARIVREMLKEEGAVSVAVTHATRLREALVFLQEQDFSAVLLDLTLPDSEGLETFAKARAEAPRAPIVVLTGLADEAFAAMAVRQGAQDYLVKGRVDGRLLYQSLRYAVERSAVIERLHRSEARYRSLVEGSIQGILIHVDGVVRFANQALASIVGATRAGDLIGRSIWTFVAEEDRPRVAAYTKARIEGRAAPEQYELRVVRQDGARIWLECLATAIAWEGETAILATLVDITERRRAEDDLRVSEERFRQLADNVKEAFMIVDLPDFRTVYLSGAWSGIWGRPADEAYANPNVWLEAIHPEDRAAVQAGQQSLLRGEPATNVFRVLRPDQTSRWVRARTFPVFNADRQVYRLVGLAEDITEVRRTEEQLQQAQRMEAVGRLAGGIAHDFNNYLSAILGFSDLVLTDLGPDHPSAADVQQILQAGQSAEGLTRQLLVFSRRQVLQPQTLNLNDALRRVQSLLRRVIGEDIVLTLNLTEPLPFVSADPGQIEQVIMNLAINARDAMPGGGRLTIETVRSVLDDQYVSEHVAASAGPYVMVAVTDTGTGMDATTRTRLFEPLFTTKEPGKGTGLGLATVYGIVQQSRGAIWVYSELGVGSTFKMYFPEVEGSNGLAAASPKTERPPLAGTETILVVEDQPELRAVVRQILQRQGYTVLEASNGRDALGIARRHPSPIHALLTDVVMPGMGGRRLAELLEGIRPEVRPIYMSGYTDDTIVSHGILDSDLAFIQKPFTPSALVSKVREVLDAPEPPRR